jgi:hypothetical protein
MENNRDTIWHGDFGVYSYMFQVCKFNGHNINDIVGQIKLKKRLLFQNGHQIIVKYY